MGLEDVAARLPPGFRFYPSDEELVSYYLFKKVADESRLPTSCTLVDVDLHICEPWQLPDAANLGEDEWYFFSFKDRKYATGLRANRATKSGYWKATGKDRPVLDPSSHEIVGMRKTLVFYKGRAPRGVKTGWIMHEFRLESSRIPPKEEDWVLCRVYQQNKQVHLEEPNALNNESNDNITGWFQDVNVSLSSSYINGANLENQIQEDNVQYEGNLDNQIQEDNVQYEGMFHQYNSFDYWILDDIIEETIPNISEVKY